MRKSGRDKEKTRDRGRIEGRGGGVEKQELKKEEKGN